MKPREDGSHAGDEIQQKLNFKICDAVRLGLDTFFMLDSDKVDDMLYSQKERIGNGVTRYRISAYGRTYARMLINTTNDTHWWGRTHDWDVCKLNTQMED